MTRSPSEKDTKRQLDAIFAKAKAQARANPDLESKIAADLLRKALLALAATPKPDTSIATNLPIEVMTDAINETKRQVYAIFDNHPIADEYRGDLASLVLVSILEDCAEGMNLGKSGVLALVKHTQETLHHNFSTEIESVKRTDPKS